MGRAPGGGRRRSFRIGCCSVQVMPVLGEDDPEAERFTTHLAYAAAGVAARHDELTGELEAARAALGDAAARLAIAERAIPPKQPQRLLGPGCVRFSPRSKLWLLGQREKGWASFGFELDGWDDLFRRYAVTITEHGVDEHGMWWTATPSQERYPAGT